MRKNRATVCLQRAEQLDQQARHLVEEAKDYRAAADALKTRR
jgi:hypothetical protein